MTNYGYSAETKFLFYFLPLFYTRNCTDYLFKDKERPANDNEKKNFPIYSITLRGKASVVTCFCDIYTIQFSIWDTRRLTRSLPQKVLQLSVIYTHTHTFCYTVHKAHRPKNFILPNIYQKKKIFTKSILMFHSTVIKLKQFILLILVPVLNRKLIYYLGDILVYF